MNKPFLSLSIVVTFLLAACTMDSYIHLPPEKITIDNEKFINRTFDKAWNNVAGVFFSDTVKLETSDKASGTVIASFTTDRPINYIDCGVVKRKYRDNDKLTHEYTYSYADSTEYSYEENGQIYDAKVKTDLITEITAKVASLGDGSKITVNTHYTLNREVTATNTADDSKLPTKKEQITFTTTEPYKTETFSCSSNGAIENNILSNIK